MVETPVEPLVRPRRRGRTTLLIAGAAVLGLVAGTCAGYLVQADREPTKLPPLSQPVLKQAKGEAEPLSAAQDRRVKTDGDLRKLLLKKPAGAKESDLADDDGWMELADYADLFEHPENAFGNLISEEFRRAAVTSWKVGSTYGVEIRLIQYRQEETLQAPVSAENEQYWADAEDGTESWPVAGSGNGMAYVHTEPDTEPGYLPQYSAEAIAWRGDILMEIYVWDTKLISKKKIMDLAERQMERL
ncbi:hypothetical protein [Streptomyces fulvoviolaceus]|uniref:hypothetical protein n=1 Tax=Streptomyces fulvoviolaceus TaxID=285535 RepID=UPI0006950848|nr:hypothetical protein [Streptomyces fulvoviolaceus]MCT9077122.1 hypothetical protein [Streptomyces fulvoviolaceus]